VFAAPGSQRTGPSLFFSLFHPSSPPAFVTLPLPFATMKHPPFNLSRFIVRFNIVALKAETATQTSSGQEYLCFNPCLAFNNKASGYGKYTFYALTASQQMRLKRFGISGQFDLNHQTHKKSQFHFAFQLSFFPFRAYGKKKSQTFLSAYSSLYKWVSIVDYLISNIVNKQ
jgi:hypothetical protein